LLLLYHMKTALVNSGEESKHMKYIITAACPVPLNADFIKDSIYNNIAKIIQSK
jgi:hypothetical protein